VLASAPANYEAKLVGDAQRFLICGVLGLGVDNSAHCVLILYRSRFRQGKAWPYTFALTDVL
jgi:hypothetical protein